MRVVIIGAGNVASVVGRLISIRRLSSHLRFLKASEVAIISASIEDGDPTLCLPLLQPR
jgi:saccharopine dehydrogenase-like NADP-dependent oxidoreductase